MSKTDLKNKVILVTGAAGFIGAALCKRLLTETEVLSIIGIDNLNDSYDVSLKEYRLEKFQEDSAFTFIKGDIVDMSFLTSVFEKYRPQLVVHLAAQAGIRNSITNPVACIESNIIGFFNILECCRQFPVEHLVYASSSSVYGENAEAPYTTTDRTDSPVSLYAATKKSDEVMAYAYSKLYHIPTTGLRLFTVYGPEGRPDMAYFSFAEKMANGEDIQIFNYGNCQRDFTYIDDIIEGITRVMGKPPAVSVYEEDQLTPPCAIYNIGSGSPQKILDFIDALCQELIRVGVLPKNYDIERHRKLLPRQPGDMEITHADTTHLEHDFGFRPNTSLHDGLRCFSEWFKEFYKMKEEENIYPSRM